MTPPGYPFDGGVRFKVSDDYVLDRAQCHRIVYHGFDARRVAATLETIDQAGEPFPRSASTGSRPTASETHCLHGHAWTAENTYLHPSGRRCRACRRDANRRRAA